MHLVPGFGKLEIGGKGSRLLNFKTAYGLNFRTGEN
jgi:hypothetical protein